MTTPTSGSTRPPRIEAIDILKGIMILAMVGYHFLYDLVFFCGVPYEYYANPICDTIQFLICSVFILCSGASAKISRSNYKHALRIGFGALIITAVTYFFDPNNFVVFGILHFLAAASLIYALAKPILERIPGKLQPFLWSGLFIVLYLVLPVRTEISHLWLFGLLDSSFSSSDYFPLFPWIFLFFFGTWLGKPLFSGAFPKWFYKLHAKPLAWCGKNSFYIYMAHQPFLMGIVMLIQAAM